MNDKIAYSATTALIYSILFYILMESPDGVGFANSPLATFNYKSLFQLAFLFPFVCHIVFIFCVFLGTFVGPIFKSFHMNTDEIVDAIMIHIPVAVIIAIMSMALGIKIIGELVI